MNLSSLGASAVPGLSVLCYILPDYLVFRAFLPSPFSVEFTFLFILLAVCWYFMKTKPAKITALAVCSLLFRSVHSPVQSLMILALPFLLLYNGKKGKAGLKYLFYIYYPAHQILFYLLTL
jgi:hypothetical protein